MHIFSESIGPADQVNRRSLDFSWTKTGVEKSGTEKSAAENTPALSLLSIHFEPSHTPGSDSSLTLHSNSSRTPGSDTSRTANSDTSRSTEKTYQSPYSGRVRDAMPKAPSPNSLEAPKDIKPEPKAPEVTKDVPKELPKSTVDPNRNWSTEFSIAYHSMKAFEKFDIDGNSFLSRKELKTIAESWYGVTWTDKDKQAAKYILQNYPTILSMHDDSGNEDAIDPKEKDKQRKLSEEDYSVNQTQAPSEKGSQVSMEKEPKLSEQPTGELTTKPPKDQPGISTYDTMLFALATSPNFDPTSKARWDTFHAVKYPLATCIGAGLLAGALSFAGGLPRARAALAKAAAVSGIYVATELSGHSSRVQRYTDLQTLAASLTRAERAL